MSKSTDREFAAWVAARGRALERYAFVLSGDGHRAQDLVQNTLLRVYRQWNRVSGMDHRDAYARQVLTNQYLDWRRRRYNSEIPDPIERHRPVPDVAVGVIARDELARALQGITPHQRAVLVLRHIEGLDDDAIGAVLGCSATTVRSHAARGRERLRVLMSGNDLDSPSGRSTQ